MSLFKIFDVSGSAISAQSQRLNVVASNLANAELIAGARPAIQGSPGGVPDPNLGTDPDAAGVRVTQVVQDKQPALGAFTTVQSDGGCGRNGHDANVNPVEEMVNMIRLAQLPDQRRRDEYGQEPAAEVLQLARKERNHDVHATSALASPLQQTPTGASSATATSSSATGTSAQSLSDTFLKLLVAQMKNQDTLKPVDNSQVTSQMGRSARSRDQQPEQHSQPAGVAVAAEQAVQSTQLAGHTVLVPGSSLTLATSGQRLELEPGAGRLRRLLADTGGDSVSVAVKDSTGATVRTIKPGRARRGPCRTSAGTARPTAGLRPPQAATRIR